MLTSPDHVILIARYKQAVEDDRPVDAEAFKQAWRTLLSRGADADVLDMIEEDVFGDLF
jgi:hypothetical protein